MKLLLLSMAVLGPILCGASSHGEAVQVRQSSGGAGGYGGKHSGIANDPGIHGGGYSGSGHHFQGSHHSVPSHYQYQQPYHHSSYYYPNGGYFQPDAYYYSPHSYFPVSYHIPDYYASRGGPYHKPINYKSHSYGYNPLYY